MKEIHKLYLKHFLLSFTGFGLIYWSFELFELSKPLIIRLLIKSAVVGVVFTILTVYSYVKKLKNKGMVINSENLKVRHKKVITTQKNSEEILSKIKQHADFKALKITKTNSGFKINKNLSWSSWGEVVEINIKSKDSENKSIEISSKPKYPLTLLDNGRNKENVETITALIRDVA